MFIGHFAIAYIFVALFPGVPPIIPLIGVSFPDLLWPFLIFTGAEEVSMDPESPLQNMIQFTRLPFSHSLVLGSLIAAIFGISIAFLVSLLAGVIFIMASASHWLLDGITHVGDLPVLGFGKDRKVGLALWARPKAAFILELIFYTMITVPAGLAINPGVVVPLLGLGFAFHLANANSFLGFSKKNPFNTPRRYAAVAFFGFLVFILLAFWILAG
jgi:hypothetical protein